MSQSLIDHRGPKFAALLHEVLDGLKAVLQTARGRVVIFPCSGTGAWEACIVNTLSPGDRVLGCANGYFSNQFCHTATAHGIQAERLEFPYGPESMRTQSKNGRARTPPRESRPCL